MNVAYVINKKLSNKLLFMISTHGLNGILFIIKKRLQKDTCLMPAINKPPTKCVKL